MKPRLTVNISSHRIWAELGNGREAALWVGEADRSNGDDLREALAALLVQAPRTATNLPAEILLHRPIAQVRHLDHLPPVRGAALRALVDHQASTFFRKNGRPLVTSAGWLPATVQEPRRAVVAAIDSEIADAIAAGIEQAGFSLAQCTVADLRGAEGLDLLPPLARERRDLIRRDSLLRLGTIAVIAWALVLGLWGVRYGIDVIRTRVELARLGPARTALLAGQLVRHRAESMLATLDAAEANRHALEDRILAIAGALPDSAYLSSLEVDSIGAGLLTGGARRAADLVASLDRSHAVSNPALEGPPSDDPLGGKWQGFTIRFGGHGQ